MGTVLKLGTCVQGEQHPAALLEILRRWSFLSLGFV